MENYFRVRSALIIMVACCHGAKVKIISCRPKFSKNQPIEVGFFVSAICRWYKDGKMMVKRLSNSERYGRQVILNFA